MRARSLIAVASAVLALGGCGGDDSASSDSGPDLPENPSEAAYIEAADEICQDLYAQRDAIERTAAQAEINKDAEAAGDALDNAAGVTEDGLDKLQALPRPEGDEAALDRLYRRGRGVVNAGHDAADAVRDGDPTELAAASQVGALSTQAFNKTAIEYGFLVCGRGQAAEVG